MDFLEEIARGSSFGNRLLSAKIFLAFVLLIVIYRALRFKRSKRWKLPPGPRPWPIVGNLLQVGPIPHHGMQKLTKDYGPLVYLRLGFVPAVVTDDPKFVGEFLRKQDHIFSSRPRTIASEHFTYGGQDIAFSPYNSHWKSMRRLCLFELLTPKRLDLFRKGRLEEVQCMVREVLDTSKAGNCIALRDTFGALSSNILTRMMLGKRHFGAGNAGPKEAAEHKNLIYAGFSLVNSFNVADYLPFLRPFDLQGHEKGMRKVMAKVDRIYDAIIKEHLQRRTEIVGEEARTHSNFVDQLLSLPGENGEAQLSHTTIKAILIDMVAAGTDTSSVTSEWTMAELIRHPDIMQKVSDEIDSVVGSDRVVEENDLSKLRYLKAVVKEIFRLHPVGAFLIPHVSLEDTQVAGYDVPKNTRVLINTYSLGRNPRVWERPLEFWPERFLEENVELSDSGLRIVPFGSGRRGCPGATLGSGVVLLGLARLIQGFHWSPPPPQAITDMDLGEAYGLMVLAQPLRAVATPRLSSHLY